MRNVPKLELINVTRAIIHAVDAKGPEVFSSRLIKLQGSPTANRIRAFLTTHALRTWNDSGSHTAQFTIKHLSRLSTSVGQCCERRRIRSPVATTAVLLQNSMKTHPNITPGNLVVCDCSDGELRYIALMKLDTSSGVQRRIEGTEVELLDVPDYFRMINDGFRRQQ